MEKALLLTIVFSFYWKIDWVVGIAVIEGRAWVVHKLPEQSRVHKHYMRIAVLQIGEPDVANRPLESPFFADARLSFSRVNFKFVFVVN